MWTLCVIVSQEPYVYKCLYIHLQTHLYKYACVCAHAFVSSARCPLKLVRRAVWQAIQRLCVQLLLCVTSLFHLASLQAGGEMGYSAMQGRWLIPSSAGAGLYPWFLIH